jgi:prepilin-type N-terminal cleavage/methylation domain-containing protein
MRLSPKNPMKGQANNRGFTLVEFLVSLTLVTFLLTGTVQLTIYSLLVKRNAELNFKIAEHASSLFEHFKSLPYESKELKEGLVAETIKEEDSFETFIRKWKIEEISPHLKEIELEVTSEKYSDWFCIYPESLVSDMIKITVITKMIICIDSSENFTYSSLYNT